MGWIQGQESNHVSNQQNMFLFMSNLPSWWCCESDPRLLTTELEEWLKTSHSKFLLDENSELLIQSPLDRQGEREWKAHNFSYLWLFLSSWEMKREIEKERVKRMSLWQNFTWVWGERKRDTKKNTFYPLPIPEIRIFIESHSRNQNICWNYIRVKLVKEK